MQIKPLPRFVIKAIFIIWLVTNPAASLVGVQGLPAGQRAAAGDVLHPAAVGDETLLRHHVIKVAGIELGEAVLFGDVDLRKSDNTSQRQNYYSWIWLS